MIVRQIAALAPRLSNQTAPDINHLSAKLNRFTVLSHTPLPVFCKRMCKESCGALPVEVMDSHSGTLVFVCSLCLGWERCNLAVMLGFRRVLARISQFGETFPLPSKPANTSLPRPLKLCKLLA